MTVMSRPWLFQFGPIVIPSSGREALYEIGINRTPAEIADAVWRLRMEGVPVRKSHKKNWPNKPVVSNVVLMKKRKT